MLLIVYHPQLSSCQFEKKKKIEKINVLSSKKMIRPRSCATDSISRLGDFRRVYSVHSPEPHIKKVMKKLIATLLTITFCDLAIGFKNVYPKLQSYPYPADADVGDPLILTPLIESRKIDLARQKATVQHKEMRDVGSYSGYFTVNKEYNSNLFFWFFPAKVTNSKNFKIHYFTLNYIKVTFTPP